MTGPAWPWPGGGALGRALAVGTACLALADCSSTQATRSRPNKYGVAPSPRVIAEGQPIPKGGGREMTGNPYVVGGRTYVPHGGRGYDREGWASWYGSAFHGRLTANGEVLDREAIAAAHPTLPLPSYVRVTNVTNGRSMIVRVNDRGPYEYNRLIDISERAADALGFKRSGTTRVRVQYVGKASVSGSDDQKLLATLRTDGSAAPAGSLRGATAVASRADPEERPAQRRVLAARTPDPRDDEEDDGPLPPRRAPEPTRPAPRTAVVPAAVAAPLAALPAAPTRRMEAAAAEDEEAEFATIY